MTAWSLLGLAGLILVLALMVLAVIAWLADRGDP
jgi:hypothetical protein